MALFAAVLRSVNIPVVQRTIELDAETHCGPFFPTVDRVLPHADEVHNLLLTPSTAAAPTELLFHASASAEVRFYEPTVHCAGGDCNTVGEQSSYNLQKDVIMRSFQYMTDGILYKYAKYGEQHLDDFLRGPVGSPGYVLPLFNAAQRRFMIEEIREEVEKVGNGGPDLSMAIIRSRYERYHRNK
jgi:hypothetical protein